MRRRQRNKRTGNVIVLTAALMIGLMACLALAIDVGYINVVQSESQRAADSASIAAAWELIEEGGFPGNPATRAEAAQFANLNHVAQASPLLGSSDVEIGHIAHPSDPNSPMTFADPDKFNSVQVRVRRNPLQNGEVALFFARALGRDRVSIQADATAAFLNNVRGFRIPSPGGDPNVKILPFSLDEDTWNDLLAASTADDWTWDENWKEVSVGADGKCEVNLFPQGTGSPGNRGTVDIGGSNNSAADIARQILNGVSPADLAQHGGSVELNAANNYELDLNGDTGISAGVKDELEAIVGQPRMIPIFRECQYPGNNAQYTIVHWGGVRIMEVRLTGPMNKKRVMIQLAKVITRGGIETSDDVQTSSFVYSPVWLIR